MNPSGFDPGTSGKGAGHRVVRHKLPDRLLHWFMALCILVLLGTSLLPILGFKFAWVKIHWITGLLLILGLLIHIVRSLFWKSPLNMWFGWRDVMDMLETVHWDLTGEGTPPSKPGKFSPAQKLLHYAMTLIVLTAIVTGLMMMVKIDTPFWERNTYWLSEDKWGIVYVLHGFSALFSITMIMIHMYFACRPEKLMYTRSMLRGWISKEEYLSHHSAERWNPTE